MSYSAGSAFISITPSFAGFVKAINAKFSEYGEQAGQVFSDTFKDIVKSGTDDTSVGPTDESSTKQGSSAGGKFADSFKTRIDAALKNLPDITIDANTTDADLKIEEIKVRLEDLGNLNIGVDISDKDALAALEILKLELDEVALKSPSIRVKVDAAAAIAELEAVKLAADDANGASGGGGGLSGLAGTFGQIVSSGPATWTAIGLIATALTPVAAAAAGVALGLAGMATAVTLGVGAFGLAALPIFKEVSTALQQISADQLAVTRATSQATKNTAVTHLNDDLNNLSPTLKTVVTGVLDAKAAFMNWDAQFQPAILGVFSAALADVKPILNVITPLVNAGASAMKQFFTVIGQTAQQKDFKDFISWIATQVGPAVSAFQTAFDNFSGGFSKMLENSGPLIPMVEKGLISLSKQFENMASSKSFKDFIAYIVKNAPSIGKLFEDTAKTIGKLIAALAPLGPGLTNALDRVVNAIGHTVDIVKIVAKAINLAFVDMKKFFEDTIPHAASVFSGAITTAFQDVHNIVNTIWHAIDNDVFHPIENFFTETIPHAASVFSGAITTGFQSVHDIINTIWHAIDNDVLHPIEDAFNVTVIGAIHAMRDAWNDVFNGLSSAASTAWGWIEPILNGIIGGVRAAVWALDLLPFVNIPLPNYIGASSGPGLNYGSLIGANLIPGYASGTGTGTTSGMVMVGEKGPELANFGSPVQIIKNSDLTGSATSSGRQGHGLNIEHADFHNEADLEVLNRKANFAYMARSL